MSNLDRALRKVTHHRAGVWCGYLTPSEILAVIDAGAVITNDWKLDWIKEDVRKGQCRPTWFYFTPRKQLLPLLPKRDNKKVGTAEKL